MSDKLSLTLATLNAAKDLKEMFELPAVRHNAMMNRIKTLGVSENQAAMHYEREKILFFKALQANKKLEECDRFSIYSCWIELHASGRTLNDGDSYMIPYGKQAQFQIGWKGRLDQMGQIPEIQNIPPPQVVYENDEFDYALGDSPFVKHKPAKVQTGNITHVYLVIQKTTGKEIHVMTRAEVHAIRDRYSKTYTSYIADCVATGTKIGDPVKKTGQYGPYVVEPPMWVTAEPEAWKKTLVKRAYKSQANKSARMKAIDAKIAGNVDPEDGSGGETTHDIDYGIVDENGNKAPEVIYRQNSIAASGIAKPMPDPITTPAVDLGNLSDSF